MKDEQTSDKDEGFLLPYIYREIFEARLKAKLSQEALAKLIGSSDATVRRIESGQGSIHPALLKKLCDALGLSYTDLVTRALIKTWRALHGPEGAGPFEDFRERLLARFDARKSGDRDFLEDVLDYASFLMIGLRSEAGSGS